MDCTIHGRLCHQHGVRAYPTTVFFNNSRCDDDYDDNGDDDDDDDDDNDGDDDDNDEEDDFRPHKYEGGHHARDLADFVEDILRPVVVPLTVSRDDGDD